MAYLASGLCMGVGGIWECVSWCVQWLGIKGLSCRWEG